jgi:hypothetical protein
MSQFIQHAPDDVTAWICQCANTPTQEGLAPCDPSGEEMESTATTSWAGHYRCDRCQRIIDQTDRRVVGSRPQSFRFTWQGIAIVATYIPIRWQVISHLEIRSVEPRSAPLPITQTGYLSHFMQPGTIEAHGGDVAAQVTAWLDEAAATPEWQEHAQATRQLQLF